ncbi:hypothetical protein [Chitinophaga rhizophila]|uniref:Outer membrane protein with beta-barrel domain n=1 Tax=Chitinophaga rhizophila TaxID=2866212 RepID=A0ABS7GHG3_9BACT|nr:hypothetical protein [Chitinophaga rhizophila]MBW8687123.1 hypothetical protein [Chitinophaga rhizophila]
MSEQNLSDQFFNNEEHTIPIPPVDQGWTAMQQKLDAAMPVKGPASGGEALLKKSLLKNVLISGTAATITAVAIWQFMASDSKRQTPPAVAIHQSERPLKGNIPTDTDSLEQVVQSGQIYFPGNNGAYADKSSAIDPAVQPGNRTGIDGEACSIQNADRSHGGLPADSRRVHTGDIYVTDRSAPANNQIQQPGGITGKRDYAAKHNGTAKGQLAIGKDSSSRKGQSYSPAVTDSIGSHSSRVIPVPAASVGYPRNGDAVIPARRPAGAGKQPYKQEAGLSIHQQDLKTPEKRLEDMSTAGGSTLAPGIRRPEKAAKDSSKVRNKGITENSRRQGAVTDKRIEAARRQADGTLAAGGDTLAYSGDPSQKAANDDSKVRNKGITENSRRQGALIDKRIEAAHRQADGTLAAGGDTLAYSGDRPEKAVKDGNVVQNGWALEPIGYQSQRFNSQLQVNNGNPDRIAIKPVNKKGTKDNHSWSIYGQVNLAVPTHESKYYLTGPEGNNQYFRAVIPAIRIERRLGKMAISLDAIPMLSVQLNDSLHHHAPVNSTINKPYSTSTLKQFGYGFALQYQYLLTNRLRISAGAQLSVYSKALMQHADMRDSSLIYDPPYLRSARSNERDSLPNMRIGAVIEACYQFGQWQTGIKTMIPWQNFGGTPLWNLRPGPQIELIIRRRIFTR